MTHLFNYCVLTSLNAPLEEVPSSIEACCVTHAIQALDKLHPDAKFLAIQGPSGIVRRLGKGWIEAEPVQPAAPAISLEDIVSAIFSNAQVKV